MPRVTVLDDRSLTAEMRVSAHAHLIAGGCRSIAARTLYRVPAGEYRLDGMPTVPAGRYRQNVSSRAQSPQSLCIPMWTAVLLDPPSRVSRRPPPRSEKLGGRRGARALFGQNARRARVHPAEAGHQPSVHLRKRRGRFIPNGYFRFDVTNTRSLPGTSRRVRQALCRRRRRPSSDGRPLATRSPRFQRHVD